MKRIKIASRTRPQPRVEIRKILEKSKEKISCNENIQKQVFFFQKNRQNMHLDFLRFFLAIMALAFQMWGIDFIFAISRIVD